MNANAQDFDPNRVANKGGGGFETQYTPSHYDPSAMSPNTYGGMQETSGGAYYDPSTGFQPDYNAYYPPETAAFTAASDTLPWNEQIAEPQESLLPGCYYPTVPNVLQPQLYGAPISAVAYDNEYEAIYVTSQSQSYSRTKRDSMMAVHSTLDGMLYSSCAAHPEASASTLQTIYNVFYRSPTSSTASTTSGRTSVPGHAFQPFGTDNTTTHGGMYSKYQLGVTTLLPMKGYVASVSPSAVRIHTHGGLCVSDVDIEGMVAGTMHPGHVHISVGGVAIGKHSSHVHCMDLYQNLRVVSSTSFRSSVSINFGVMCMATNHDKQTMVAGCSDGTLRLLDGSFRSRRSNELAQVKSHAAGVSNVAVSRDGNLVCTTGFASRCSASGNTVPYAFPDQNVLIYDVRYLGRGGILHPFSAVNGGPRLVSFIPDVPDQPSNRVLVASGQAKGGIQIMTPFDTSAGTDFLVPQLSHRETITSLHVSEQFLAIGTSQCNVLQYEMAGYVQEQQQHAEGASSSMYGVNVPEFIPSSGGYGGGVTASSSGIQGAALVEKKPLVLPSYVPELPAMSMDPSLLQSTGDAGMRNGAKEKLKSIFTAYTMCVDPTISKNDEHSAFNAFCNSILLTTPKRNVSNQLLTAASKFDGDAMSSIMTCNVGVDLFETEQSRKGKDGGLPNPNRLLHSKKLSAICYEKSEASQGGRRQANQRGGGRPEDGSDDEADNNGIPKRYRKTLKPSHSKGAAFSHAQYNDTGLWPGWDYPSSMPNAYAPPVLLWLYFVPEIRSMLMSRQFDRAGKPTATAVPPLSAELGCVFHQIDSLSKYARIYPDESVMTKVGAFVPANLLASFASMPEADALALLDGNPAAVERARRPEAFLRFLLHHLHKEVSAKKGGSKIIDTLHGFTFVSINEFITGSGSPVVSKQHAMTVDLSYDPFVKKSERVKFGEVLRHALSKESPLRAWCKESRSYETVVQRKIATSLPSALALSCCCAGNHNEEGLDIWRNSGPDNGHWLPEFVEVEIEGNGNVIVRELTDEDGTGDKIWMEFKSSSDLPPAVADIVKSNLGSSRKHRYRLDAVLSFIRDQSDGVASDEVQGHHVLHARIPPSYKRQAYDKQRAKAQTVAASNEAASEESVPDKLTLTSEIKKETLEKRIEDAEERIKALDQSENETDDWVLFNGFVVTPTVSEDARAFHVPFKDPCLIMFRAVDDNGNKNKKKERKNSDGGKDPAAKLGLSCMQTKSIYTGRKPEYNPHRSNMLPGQGDLIAFDAEFVCVQEEESELTDRGSKVTVRETRLALARMSVIDCHSGTVIVDDYVIPSEPVVDYLTRFSGITAADLDPKTSPHHLVTMQSAYLKLRYLTEKGCIFVGHGLSQDFLTVNLVVPPDQIIDTVEIYHQDRMRWISLRFLTNYVFGRDMQQDVHDSVEDARAAHALYLKALELKREGMFDKFLQDLYVYGAARDWKLGVDE